MSAAAPADAGPYNFPPGPKYPKIFQSLGMLTRLIPYGMKMRDKYGDAFTLDIIGFGKFVVLSDPDLIKQTFTADAKALHAGEGSPLGAVLGSNSLLAIDEDRHLNQRRLLLPPFHGERMKQYEALIEEIATEVIDSWPVGKEFQTIEYMQLITLRAILQAVFGAHGGELEKLETLIPKWVTWASAMTQFPFMHRDLGRFSPWGHFLRLNREVDEHLNELIAEARSDENLADRVDVLAMLVQAKHEDDAPMTDQEIRDQLMTLLAAGHETTASSLSWAVDRLRRHPEALARLVQEVDDGGNAYRAATIHEVMRVRPVVAFSARLIKKPFQLGEYLLPPGARIALSATLAHTDPRLFEDPKAFKPERFLDTKPETYAWIPFGGGVRRCIGAAFAQMEMDVVLRVMLQRIELLPTDAPAENFKFRGVTYTPSKGGLAEVRRRDLSDSGAALEREAVPAGV
ncbi:MAG TPA: cytochrome P450 [Solirubrobacterales bacterium]|jgi:hypothetical protein|nr:cytochrome P450 [Solirubrobacterales bacterium]